MKKTISVFLANILFICFLFAYIGSYAQTEKLSAKVDERVELVSIIFKLAGVKSYQSNEFELYTNRIGNYFLQNYRYHPAITEAQRICRKFGVSYATPMQIALSMAPNTLEPIRFFNKGDFYQVPGDSLRIFVSLAKQFYEDTDFKTFYRQNADLYKKMEERFSPITYSIDFQWFKQNFTQEVPNTECIISVANGRNNYSVWVLNKDSINTLYPVISSGKVDDSGYIYFPINYNELIIHEMLHYYVNNLTQSYRTDFEEFYPELYAKVEDKMRKQAYGAWNVSLNESLVRALVIKYLKDKGSEQQKVDSVVAKEIANGFFWMPELVNAIQEIYSQNGNKKFESLFPLIISRYKDIADSRNELFERNKKL